MSKDRTLRVTVGEATGGEEAVAATRATGTPVRAVGPSGADALEPLALTQGDSFDPESGIPKYKVSSVRVEPAGPDAVPSTLPTPSDD